ncbi:universal stress protein [Conyzicola nivalis]|uniref:Universal stress protein n=1 Tax=Conyzicola nivalis TaxID=1477021 RepID=A0A916WG31_9MICO|nr:universal stress protein [Conyzicola nivalis]GGA94387.1 universal stress protein [Conyzicola nivalis]
MERVCVAIDGTASGEAAIDWVVERSAHTDLEISVTAVYDPLPSESVLAGGDYRALFSTLLGEAVRRIEEAAPGARVEGTLRTGQPRAQLVAASSEADLLVIGTGRSGAGSYATLPIRIASTARCPVVVVPAPRPAPDSGVVVGLESTAQQPLVVDFAASEAQKSGQPLTVAHCWSVPKLIAVAMFAHPGVWSRMQDLHARALAETLAHVRAGWPGLELHQRFREGPSAVILAEEAAGASLLVVGRHDRATVGDTLLGSTSHELLLGMTCPIAVVPE